MSAQRRAPSNRQGAEPCSVGWIQAMSSVGPQIRDRKGPRSTTKTLNMVLALRRMRSALAAPHRELRWAAGTGVQLRETSRVHIGGDVPLPHGDFDADDVSAMIA